MTYWTADTMVYAVLITWPLGYLGLQLVIALMTVKDVVRGWRHRREVRVQNAVYERYGIVYRIGAPPKGA